MASCFFTPTILWGRCLKQSSCYLKKLQRKTDVWKQVFRENSGLGSSKPTKTFGALPIERPPGGPSSQSPHSLLKPFLFAAGFSSATFVGCTIWQYENYRNKIINQKRLPFSGWMREHKAGQWRQQCNDVWNRLSEGQKLFFPVLLANGLVFLAWRAPRLQPFMIKWFASNPAARVICWPMFLSTFSHYSFFHLAANMYVLNSFTPAVVSATGKEQATFLYLTAGIIASFSSLCHKVIIRQPGLSIGASGAIMGVLGYVCTQYPDTKLQIILLPMFTFTAGAALKFIVGLDLLGVVLRWKFFDHAAHLGGALTGLFWALYGHDLFWQKREPIVSFWHQLRPPKSEV